MKGPIFRLFITGRTPRSEVAIANLKRFCEDSLDGEYELEVIDVVDDPERAESEHIIATPTLIREIPPPALRIIGDLSDQDRVKDMLHGLW